MNSKLPQTDFVPDKKAQPPVSAWFRLLMPSGTDLIFVVVLVILTYGTLAPKLLGDAGTGWHIRNGEQMLQTHSLPRSDSFSSTMNGRPWYSWEWLFDLVIAGLHHWMGLDGVVFFAVFVIAAAFALLLRLTVERGGSLPVSVFLVVLSIGASTIHLFARPHVVSWLLAVIWFRLLDTSESPTGGRRLFWLPVLMILWANVHGGFLLGFALLGIYLAGGAIEYFMSGRSVETQLAASPAEGRRAIARRLKHLATVTVLALVASLLNPYGYKLHVHVYQYLTNRFLMNHIDEFLSPNFHGVAQQCFAALLLITILALASAREKLRPTHLLVILFAAYSGLYASRNLPTSSILLTLIVAPILSQTISVASHSELPARMQRFFSRLHSFSERMGNMEFQLRGHLWPIALAVLGFVVCLHQGRLGSRHIMDAHFDAKHFPVQAVNAIAERESHAPIFAPDYWGGYLIYRLYPQTQVVVDDRHDLYGEQFLKDYLRVTRVAPGWDKVLQEKGVSRVLTPEESSLANILRETAGWQITYEDKVAVLFERSK